MNRRAVAGVVAAAIVSIVIGVVATDEGSGTTSGSVTISGLPPGQHEFCVSAVDPSGNVDPTPACTTWEVVVGNEAPHAAVIWHQDTGVLEAAATGDSNIKEVLFYVNGVLASRKTQPPYERRTAKTGALALKVSVRENDGDLATTTVYVTR